MNSAQSLLDLHWDGSLPVDVEALAARAGVQVDHVDVTDPPGFACRAYLSPTGARRITVNTKLSSVAKRFALAHALGHFVLEDVTVREPSHVDLSASFSTTAPVLEQRANRFAMALLAPERMLHFVIGQGGHPSLQSLCEAFGLSEVAMANRLRVLGLVRD